MPPKTSINYLDKDRYSFPVLACLLAAAVFFLYSVSIGHNFYFDEENIILNNPTIRSLTLIPEIFKHGYFYFHGRPQAHWDEYYRPLTTITYSIDYFFWGVNPLGYNLTNLWMHMLLCVLYFRLLEKLLEHRTAAFLAALLYSVHTIHTEAVTYTASRGDILVIVLMLAAMLFYIRRKPMAALACYALALFSKETAILLPFYILALDLGFVKSRPKDLPKNTGPFFLVMICFWLYRKFLCPIPFTPLDSDFHAVLMRVLGMGDGILRYLRILVAPEYFRPFSDVPVLYGFGDPLIWTAVTVASLLLAAWFLSLRKMGIAFFGMTVLLVGLVPHIQLMRVYPKWAEHYICIACLGLFLLLGILIRGILKINSRRLTVFFLIIYLPFLSFISFRTWQRNQTYNDAKRYYTLLSQADTPYRFYGYQQLARLAIEEGKLPMAHVYLSAALQQEFRSEFSHELMGHYYLRLNRPAKAMREFRLAYYYSAASSRELPFIGGCLIELGRYREAAAIFELMRRIEPDSPVCYTQLMNVYELLHQPGRVNEWAEAGRQALRDTPGGDVPIQMFLARLDYGRGDFEAARQKIKKVLSGHPPVSGNTELARFCLGRINSREFLAAVGDKYPYLRNSAPALVLMAAVLNGDKAAAREALQKDDKKLLKLSRKNPLIRREARVVRHFIAG